MSISPLRRFSPWWLLPAVLVSACAKPQPPARPAPVAKSRPVGPVARAGESVCALAGRTGVDVDALRAANGWKEREAPLEAGPVSLPEAALRHRVRTGESLSVLSHWYGQPVGVLARANEIEDPNRIAAGTWLRIPAGARTGCPPPAPTLARTAPRVPSVEPRPPAPPQRAEQPAEEEIEAPPVSAPPPAPAGPGPVEAVALERADTLLTEASERYDGADFEAVLELTTSARRELRPANDDPGARERHARISWLAGLAYAGLGQSEEAGPLLREAVVLEPALRDDPAISPRILGLLDEPAPGIEPPSR